jgi:hypothetical protein
MGEAHAFASQKDHLGTPPKLPHRTRKKESKHKQVQASGKW